MYWGGQTATRTSVKLSTLILRTATHHIALPWLLSLCSGTLYTAVYRAPKGRQTMDFDFTQLQQQLRIRSPRLVAAHTWTVTPRRPAAERWGGSETGCGSGSRFRSVCWETGTPIGPILTICRTSKTRLASQHKRRPQHSLSCHGLATGWILSGCRPQYSYSKILMSS